MLLLLTIALSAMLLFSLWRYKLDVSAPAVLFAGGFTLSAFWALAFATLWGYTMHANALFAVGGGVLLFVLVCFLVDATLFKGQLWQRPEHAEAERHAALLPLMLFVLVQVVACVWFLVRVRKMFPADSLSESIAAYKYANTFTTQSVYLGFPLNPLRVAALYGGYVTGFLFMRGLSDRKLSLCFIVSGVSVAITFVMLLEGGARSDFANYILSLVIYYLLLRKESYQGHIALNRRMVLVGAAGIVAFIVCFRLLAIGRHGDFSLTDTLNNVSVYIGSEIPNLDWWMQLDSQPAQDVWGSMTFFSSIRYLGPKLNIPAWTYNYDLPFISSNWHWRGNVYTTFYAFLYDFGPLGLMGCTAFMAAVSEVIWCLSGRVQRHRDFWRILHSLAAPHILFCFFSNRFYESFFAIPTYRVLIVIAVVHLFIYADYKALLNKLQSLTAHTMVSQEHEKSEVVSHG